MSKITRFKDRKMHSTDTLIGTDTVIEGKLHCSTSLRVDGTVRGDIICLGNLYVGTKGVLHSDIQAANVYLAGKIHGTVTTPGTLYIAKTGKLYGDLDIARLEVVEGAIFEGTIIMKQKEENKNASVQPKNQKVKAVK